VQVPWHQRWGFFLRCRIQIGAVWRRHAARVANNHDLDVFAERAFPAAPVAAIAPASAQGLEGNCGPRAITFDRIGGSPYLFDLTHDLVPKVCNFSGSCASDQFWVGFGRYGTVVVVRSRSVVRLCSIGSIMPKRPPRKAAKPLTNRSGSRVRPRSGPAVREGVPDTVPLQKLQNIASPPFGGPSVAPSPGS
jgi:hypothetical protein